MSFARYSLVVLSVVTVSLSLVLSALGAWLDAGRRNATLLGAGLAVANTLLAYALVLWSERRSANVFLGAVLGGMVGRMALMLGFVGVGVLSWGLPPVPLALSLLGYFVVFLALELSILHKRTISAGRTP